MAGEAERRAGAVIIMSMFGWRGLMMRRKLLKSGAISIRPLLSRSCKILQLKMAGIKSLMNNFFGGVPLIDKSSIS